MRARARRSARARHLTPRAHRSLRRPPQLAFAQHRTPVIAYPLPAATRLHAYLEPGSSLKTQWRLVLCLPCPAEENWLAKRCQTQTRCLTPRSDAGRVSDTAVVSDTLSSRHETTVIPRRPPAEPGAVSSFSGRTMRLLF